MNKPSIFLSVVLAVFAMAGCGDSSSDNESVCESICDNSRCDEIEELRDCEDDCEEFLEDVDCERQARDYFECLDDSDCDFEGDCADEAADWARCAF